MVLSGRWEFKEAVLDGFTIQEGQGSGNCGWGLLERMRGRCAIIKKKKHIRFFSIKCNSGNLSLWLLIFLPKALKYTSKNYEQSKGQIGACTNNLGTDRCMLWESR